ncbi:MAG: hypothetical protein C4519_19080 [Desulfobacteraceae bacterium]|nr:MAG: hypothetical protein C4519_19080 [Desulfobacteraceae bacterium]
MSTVRKIEHALLGGLLMLLWICMLPLDVTAADCNCSLDTAEPPFLSQGADPNLLLMIDNSASMLDLAYVNTAGTCYDDTYNNDSDYAGYFDSATWYAYNFTNEKFAKVTDSAASTFCSASGTEYSSAYLCVDGTMTAEDMTAVSAFYATGKLLNWAAASKLDIQKEILTGGNYDGPNQRIKMESRGCGDRRFVKKVAVDYNAGTHYVTLAVRPPKAPAYADWVDAKPYDAGVVVADRGGILYKAQTSGTSNGTSPLNDTGVEWGEYWGTRWHNGTTYAKGDLVTDPSKENSIDKGKVYIATTNGTANGTGVDDDAGVAWEPYDLTHIDIFKGNATGFNNDACQLAIDELNSSNPSQGQLKGHIDDCMGGGSGGGGSGSKDANNAFNHAIHNCWYRVKHGEWITGNGTINSTQNACEDVYGNNIDPWDLTPEDRAYVCFGRYNGDSANPIGYVGRCWNPGQTSTQTCEWKCKNANKVYPAGCPNANQQEYVCTGAGSTIAGWDAGGYADVDTCIETAMQEFCGSMEVPEVIDPSDQVGSATGASDVTWGLPAMLTDSGVVAQLDQPIATLKGFIEKTAAPRGLIQAYADDIRMGVMVFNHSGSASECAQTDPYILYECANDNNKDGGKVIQAIGQSSAHTTGLVTAINAIKATSWTPLAEAYYNAVGYFKQDTAMRLNAEDFGVETDPIEYWCQNNHILIITEGGSTADQHADVRLFSAIEDQNDGDSDTDGTGVDCGTLDGSTLLDDLTWYAKNTEGLFGQIGGVDKRNLNTHIVVAGTARNYGTGECSPETLLTSAAQNGGTSLVQANDMAALKTALQDAFSAIRAEAAAGSAASVISATRSGEGAVYQAIFWPNIDGPTYDDIQKPDVTWAGEVHALLVDAHGRLFEDTGGDKALTADDRRVIFFFEQTDASSTSGETKACYGTVEDGVCSGETKSLHEVKYLWSATEWLADITATDILANRTDYISNEKKRYIFTWNDLDNDGVVDGGEVLSFEASTNWNGLAVNGSRRKVPFDFGVERDDATTNDDVNAVVNWIRGYDGANQRSREATKPANFEVDTASANNTITWRLGDVIYSTPTVVGRPAENFHLIYQDTSYIPFISKYKNRRQVVYFGGNDGMIHAINGGFYSTEESKYCRTSDCANEANGPALGAELWAYVPYNLQPQLKCLTQPDYAHRYYVDLKPRIFDVQIFDNDAVHPGGWGTILVAGMRLGGNTVEAGGSGASGPDLRKFTSAYVIFDITDPDQKPALLGELTLDPASPLRMGYTTGVPTIVPMKQGTTTKWYLVLGSGPTTLDGRSDQYGKLAVFPLDELTQSTPGAFRIPDQAPASGNDKGRWVLDDDKSFISDLITVDFHLERDYRGDAVYFGTVQGEWGSESGQGWSGKMYRFITDADDAPTAPYQWSAPKVLLNPGRPITAAASVGWDGQNYWIFFGTGRFFDKRDKSDSSSNAQEYYFGVKEPVDCGPPPSFTWSTTLGVSDLVRTDQIQIQQSLLPDTANLVCTEDCPPSEVDTLSLLIDHIAGKGCEHPASPGTAGWYQQLPDAGERNLGQATLLGGLLTFTTYVPYDDVCQPDGLSYLNAVYYQTGTAWHKAVFNDAVGTTDEEPPTVVSRLEIGHGLASTPNLHVGREDGAKAFVQTSTGAIVEIEQPNLPIDNVKSGRLNWRSD